MPQSVRSDVRHRPSSGNPAVNDAAHGARIDPAGSCAEEECLAGRRTQSPGPVALSSKDDGPATVSPGEHGPDGGDADRNDPLLAALPEHAHGTSRGVQVAG